MKLLKVVVFLLMTGIALPLLAERGDLRPAASDTTDNTTFTQPTGAASDSSTVRPASITGSGNSVTDSATASVQMPSLLTLGETPTTAAPKNDMFWIFKRKPLAIAATLGFSIPIVALEYEWWWGSSDYMWKEHGFVYRNDGWFQNYSLGVDKLGHFFTSYMYFRTFYDLMKWADYSDKTAFWFAFGIPVAHAVSVEMMDGFAKYGFSSDDLIANFLGIGYGYAQVRYPYLQNFNVKWSYFPTAAYSRPDKDWGLSHDYSGHIYWVSVNMKNVLPEPAARYWPKFLNLAVGYGASNVSYGDDPAAARHKFAFSLDYNLNAFDAVNDTFAMLLRFIDHYHFPAPGIRYINGEKVQGKALLIN